MLGEIDRDFYCSAGLFDVELDNLNKLCNGSGNCHKNLEGQRCGCVRRKWPTPEQFLEEYDEEYQDDWAVYWSCIVAAGKEPGWNLSLYKEAKKEAKQASSYSNVSVVIVCACTPWGKPPEDWRP